MQNTQYEIIASEISQIGRFEIVYDQVRKDGKVYPYSYVKMRRGVGVLGFFEGNVILLRQFRYIWDKWIWEIPGGMVDEGENPWVAAKREMEEESGYLVEKMVSLGTCYPSVGSTTELQFLYAAKCRKRQGQKLDELEKIDAELIPINKFQEMIDADEFCHGMGLAAWARCQSISEDLMIWKK